MSAETIATAWHCGDEAGLPPVILQPRPHIPDVAVHHIALSHVVRAPECVENLRLELVDTDVPEPALHLTAARRLVALRLARVVGDRVMHHTGGSPRCRSSHASE